jgi:hypothetical protein
VTGQKCRESPWAAVGPLAAKAKLEKIMKALCQLKPCLRRRFRVGPHARAGLLPGFSNNSYVTLRSSVTAGDDPSQYPLLFTNSQGGVTRRLLTSHNNPFKNLGNGRIGLQSTSVMESLVRVTKREAYNIHYDRPDVLQPIFDLFLSEPDRSYAMCIVSEKNGVRTTSLYSWRERVRADPTWRPREIIFPRTGEYFPMMSNKRSLGSSE